MGNRQRNIESIFIVVFSSTNYGLRLYKILKDKHYDVYMISTPCTISDGCSRAIQVFKDDIEEVVDEIDKGEIIISGIYKRIIRNGRYAYKSVSSEEIREEVRG